MARRSAAATSARPSESGTPSLKVRLTHPDRILYEGQGITKRELALFYARIEPWILPHVQDRLLTLLRCPEGHGSECFFQKHAHPGLPDAIHKREIREKRGRHPYVYVRDLQGLAGLVQLGCLEIHVWGSRVDRLDRPDRLVFDLDPGMDVAWDQVLEAAFEVRRRLADLDLQSFVKTTGGKGLHVVVPIERRHGWDQVKSFGRGVAEQMERDAGHRYVSVASKRLRHGRVYVDYLRNARGATSIATFSTRARPGAPVSTPVRWQELEREGTRSDRYTVRNLPQRLAALNEDPWDGFERARQRLTSAMLEAVRSPTGRR